MIINNNMPCNYIKQLWDEIDTESGLATWRVANKFIDLTAEVTEWSPVGISYGFGDVRQGSASNKRPPPGGYLRR